MRLLGCVQSFLALISPLSLLIFRFVEVSISSGRSPTVFFFLTFLLDFFLVGGQVIVPILLVQLVSVLVLLLWFLLLLFLMFLLLVLLLGSFSLFWSPGSTLLPVCLGDS